MVFLFFYIFIFQAAMGVKGGKSGTSLTLVNINHFFFDPTNKRVIGKMENEFKGIQLINLLD